MQYASRPPLIDPSLPPGSMSLQAELDKVIIDEMVQMIDDAIAEAEKKNEQAKSQAVKQNDGEKCCKCDTFYPFSEPNRPDGTLVCYSCRI